MKVGLYIGKKLFHSFQKSFGVSRTVVADNFFRKAVVDSGDVLV